MKPLTNDLNRNNPKIDLRRNPGSEINHDNIRTRKDRHQVRQNPTNRSKDRSLRDGNTAQCLQSSHAKTQPAVTKSDLVQFHPNLHRNGFPMNLENQAESVIPPIQVCARQGLDRCQTPPQNPFDRRNVEHEMEIIPSDQWRGMEKRTHRQ